MQVTWKLSRGGSRVGRRSPSWRGRGPGRCSSA